MAALLRHFPTVRPAPSLASNDLEEAVLHDRSATQEAADQYEHGRADGQRSAWLFLDESGHIVQSVAIGLGQLASRFATCAFGLQGMVTNQFANDALSLASNLLCYAFDLFAFHVSPTLINIE